MQMYKVICASTYVVLNSMQMDKSYAQLIGKSLQMDEVI